MTKRIDFVIVKFVDEDDAPGIVASKWIKDDKTSCYYPNVRTEEMKEKLLRRMAEPEESWPQYKIKILKGYETYGDARLHLRKAEDTSNLESDQELTKRKRKKKRLFHSSDESYEETPSAEITLNSTRQELTKRKRKKKRLFHSSDESDEETPSAEITLKYPTPPRPAQVNLNYSTPRSEQVNLNYLDIHADSPPQPQRSNINVMNCPSDCNVSKQLAVQQVHLVQLVTDIGKQMTELNKKVDLLLSRAQESSQQTDNAYYAVREFLTTLPVVNNDSFCSLNNHLKDKENKEALAKFLAGIGGRNARSFTTNILRRILTDEVAKQYSLTGKKMKNSSKKSFLMTETCHVIFEICKNIHNATEENIKEIISDWLNQAKVRIMRRGEREKTREEK